MYFEVPDLTRHVPAAPPDDLPILVSRTGYRADGAPLLRIKSEIMPSEDGSHAAFAGADIALARRITERLQWAYPGNFWQVEVDHRPTVGIAKIRIPVLMAADYWYVIPLEWLKTDPNMACVVRAGGECLERYSVPRGRFDLGHWLAARAKYGRSAILRKKPPE